jgi:hypothetical protein
MSGLPTTRQQLRKTDIWYRRLFSPSEDRNLPKPGFTGIQSSSLIEGKGIQKVAPGVGGAMQRVDASHEAMQLILLGNLHAGRRLRQIPRRLHSRDRQSKGRVFHPLSPILPVTDLGEIVCRDRGREILELPSRVFKRNTLQPMLGERDLRQGGDLADLCGA